MASHLLSDTATFTLKWPWTLLILFTNVWLPLAYCLSLEPDQGPLCILSVVVKCEMHTETIETGLPLKHTSYVNQKYVCTHGKIRSVLFCRMLLVHCGWTCWLLCISLKYKRTKRRGLYAWITLNMLSLWLGTNSDKTDCFCCSQLVNICHVVCHLTSTSF